MIRTKLIMIITSLALGVMLAACGGAVPAQGTDAPTQPVGSTPVETGSIEGIAAQVSAQGVTAQVVGTGAGPVLFDQTPTLLSINGETVEVYQFIDDTSALAAAASIPDLLMSSRWVSPPHFFRSGKVIVFYLGGTQEIVTALTALYGAEITAPVVQEPALDGGSGAQETMPIKIHMVAIGDNGAMGDKFGCNDSIIPILREIPLTDRPIEAALTEQFAQKDQFYGESGFYNALYQSTLSVESVTLENGLATVYLTGEFLIGGVCDDVRFQTQIEYTVLQFPEVQGVEIFLNGQLLRDLLSGQG